ncbi:kinase-like domain-containing protein [Rhizophagus clarus]|uniref:Kinase-like domain-containing protein n=1 Tax=Rhizophagus clarus TaxID=94130 RepID=A0A8H3QZQ2_9GLOM|nr:kinase-like domain-containing protein [Rhizophagus clarus]
MTETAGQLLNNVVPNCAWIPPHNRSSSIPAYPLFPEVVRQWRFFFRSVNTHINNNNNIPGGAFSTFPTETISLSVEEDAKTRLYFNVLEPVNALLGTQGAVFRASCTGLLGSSDYILCTNNSTVTKMPVEMKTRHNLNLMDHDLWEIYRHADRLPIMQADPNFRFKKRILSQVFCEMACNGLHYDSSDNNDDDYPSKKRKSSSKQIGSRKRVATSSSKGITIISGYIGGGTFGKVFSGYYDGHPVAWKTCDAYKEQEATHILKHEAYIYSILKECQGRAVPRLFYKGYIYGGYLFALVLQLIESAHHVDPERLTKEEKKLIVNHLKSIHNCGVLHNDISKQNILYEPKSRNYFFIDFDLSETVDNESPKFRKEERRLKRFLQL